MAENYENIGFAPNISRTVRDINRDIYGRDLYGMQYDAINQQEAQGLQQLTKNYDTEVLNAYGSMLGADRAVKQSNVFTGMKDYMLEDNISNFEKTIMNAYNSYLQNTASYTEQMNKARESVDASLAEQSGLLSEYYASVDDYVQHLPEMYESLDKEGKRDWLSSIDPEYAISEIVDGKLTYKKPLPKSFMQALKTNTLYAPYITDTDEFISSKLLTGKDLENMYRTFFSSKFGGEGEGKTPYTYDKYLYHNNPELYDRLLADNKFGLGSNKEVFSKSYGGDVPFTSQEAIEQNAKEYGENVKESYIDAAVSKRIKDDAAKITRKYEVRDKDKDRKAFNGEKLIGRNEALFNEYEKQLKNQGVDIEPLKEYRARYDSVKEEFETVNKLIHEEWNDNITAFKIVELLNPKNLENPELSAELSQVYNIAKQIHQLELNMPSPSDESTYYKAREKMGDLKNQLAYLQLYTLRDTHKKLYSEMQSMADNAIETAYSKKK